MKHTNGDKLRAATYGPDATDEEIARIMGDDSANGACIDYGIPRGYCDRKCYRCIERWLGMEAHD